MGFRDYLDSYFLSLYSVLIFSSIILAPKSYMSHNLHTPDTNMQAKASGVNTFQQRFISWSTLKRGSVHLIHIWMPTSASVLRLTHKIPQAIPVVHVAKCTEPMLGNGVFQAPKNKITPIIDTRNIIEYSAKNTNANLMPVNSV